jgi:hypothetical protein
MRTARVNTFSMLPGGDFQRQASASFPANGSELGTALPDHVTCKAISPCLASTRLSYFRIGTRSAVSVRLGMVTRGSPSSGKPSPFVSEAAA